MKIKSIKPSIVLFWASKKSFQNEFKDIESGILLEMLAFAITQRNKNYIIELMKQFFILKSEIDFKIQDEQQRSTAFWLLFTRYCDDGFNTDEFEDQDDLDAAETAKWVLVCEMVIDNENFQQFVPNNSKKLDDLQSF